MVLTKTGASPSLLNGGLEKIDISYWIAVASLAGVVELENANVKEEKGKAYTLGDCGFDPLGLYPKDKEGQFAMQTKEIKNGRLAMMASKYLSFFVHLIFPIEILALNFQSSQFWDLLSKKLSTGNLSLPKLPCFSPPPFKLYTVAFPF